jgi:hypothetical protein
LREEEQCRREEAERIARPQTLMPYLEACHSLSLAIDIVTDRSLTTQGDPTNPVGRVYPQRIIPWDDFPATPNTAVARPQRMNVKPYLGTRTPPRYRSALPTTPDM